MSREKPDPKLKKAVQEITEICEKYEIGAHIMLASKTHHGEYFFHFPKWSKAQLEGKGIRFKAKGKDEDQTIAASVHMFQGFQEVGGNLFMGMTDAIKNLSEHMVIEGGPKKI